MKLETSYITTQYLPREETLIHKPLEEKYAIRTCSKTVVEAHEQYQEKNPRIFLNHSYQSEESKHQVVEDLYKLENHEYVGPIEAWFQTIVGTHHSLIIRKLLVPYQLKQLVSHTLVFVEVYILNSSTSMFNNLLHTWLH